MRKWCKAFLFLVIAFLTSCSSPTQSLLQSPAATMTALSINQSSIPLPSPSPVTPTAVFDPIPAKVRLDLNPELLLDKVYSFFLNRNAGDIPFNEWMFFYVKSGGEKANPDDFTGQIVIPAKKELHVNREWGVKLNEKDQNGSDIYVAFFEPYWKTVIVSNQKWPAYGVCITASWLREVADRAGLPTRNVLGPKQITYQGTHPGAIGVQTKNQTAIISCGQCDEEMDLEITNLNAYAVALRWRYLNPEIYLWIERK